MNYILQRFLAVIVTSFFFLSLAEAPKPKYSYVYNEDVEGYELQTKWLVEVSQKGLEIEGFNTIAKTFIACASDYALEKFIYKTNTGNFQYVLQRDGDTLHVEGNPEGKKKVKSHEIGETPWLQEFGFGLRSFLESDEKNYKFCIVNPKDLGVVKMLAMKKKIETITVNDKEFKAQRIYVTLQGWKKAFWKADVWYDAESHDLLLYKANQGPNTPFTIVTLLSKQMFDLPVAK
ncbi:MAG: hypothetical protein HKM07_05880 [Chlamydiae bacterium]|nr:hypothetical protein [Chlamydiota bacterium]